MKKSSIALAIVALSVPAFAGDVTVYGVLDAGYGDINKTVTRTSGSAIKQGESAIAFSQVLTSRLGFVASEDLGGGMKAIVKVETGIGSNPMGGVVQGTANSFPSTTTLGQNGTTIDPTSLGGRELHATLDFGQGTGIKIGFGSSPIRDFTFAYDAALQGNLVGSLITNDTLTANNRTTALSLLQKAGPVDINVGLIRNQEYADNVPNLVVKNGYQASVQYTDSDKALSFGLAYQSAETSTNSAALPVAVPAVPITQTADVTTKILVFGVSYDFKVIKLTAQYGNINIDDSVTVNAVGEGKRSYENLGVNVPVGAGTLFAQYSKGKQDQIVAAGVNSVSRDLSGFTVGGKYDFSKATYAYVSYGQTELKVGAATDNAGNIGVKSNQYALGLVKKF
jgi:predicted porin